MGLLEVAIAAQHGALRGDQLHEFFAQSGGGFLRVLDFVPLDFKRFAGLHRGPGGIGEHGDAGAGIVAAAGAGLVAELMRQMSRLQFDDGADAGHFPDFFGVGGSNGAAVDGAALKGGDEHSGNARVNAEARGAVYFLRRVGAGSRFAHDSKIGGIFQRRIGGRLKLCRGGEKLRVGKASGRAGMMHGTIFRTTFGMRDVPFDGGDGDEHFASGGAGFAQIFVGSSNAKAAAGQLIAVFRVEVRLNDLHAAPIAAKFLSDEHGESGANALAHFGLAAPDFCATVGLEFQPGVGQKRGGCSRVRVRGFSWAAGKTEREKQARAGGGGGLQESATCDDRGQIHVPQGFRRPDFRGVSRLNCLRRGRAEAELWAAAGEYPARRRANRRGGR